MINLLDLYKQTLALYEFVFISSHMRWATPINIPHIFATLSLERESTPFNIIFPYFFILILCEIIWRVSKSTMFSQVSKIVTFVTFDIISQVIKSIDISLSSGISISERSPRIIFIHAKFYSSMSKPSTWKIVTIKDRLILGWKSSSRNCFPRFFLLVLISWSRWGIYHFCISIFFSCHRRTLFIFRFLFVTKINLVTVWSLVVDDFVESLWIVGIVLKNFSTFYFLSQRNYFSFQCFSLLIDFLYVFLEWFFISFVFFNLDFKIETLYPLCLQFIFKSINMLLFGLELFDHPDYFVLKFDLNHLFFFISFSVRCLLFIVLGHK